MGSSEGPQDPCPRHLSPRDRHDPRLEEQRNQGRSSTQFRLLRYSGMHKALWGALRRSTVTRIKGRHPRPHPLLPPSRPPRPTPEGPGWRLLPTVSLSTESVVSDQSGSTAPRSHSLVPICLRTSPVRPADPERNPESCVWVQRPLRVCRKTEGGTRVPWALVSRATVARFWHGSEGWSPLTNRETGPHV